MFVPVALLALGWGTRVVLFEVPLVGDHVSMTDQGPGECVSVCVCMLREVLLCTHVGRGERVCVSVSV
jgi:hypothetical protein